MPNNAGTMLWELRTAGGWTLGRLAQQAGVSKMALSRWEAGTRQPRIPELEAVLGVLNVTAAQKAQIFAHINAPRAVHQLRTITQDAGVGLLPTSGDLLRTLRLRNGMTQGDVASALGVTQSMVTRWEQGRNVPNAAQIQTLCYVLNAREEELIALTVGTFADPHDESQTWHETEEHIRAALRASVPREIELPADLFYLTLQRKTLQWAVHEERARPLLGLLYGRYAQFLRNHKRYGEVHAVAQKALQFSTPDDPDSFARALVLSATGAVYLRNQVNPARGIAVLRRGLKAGVPAEFRAWIYSDIATYSELMGETEQSVSLLTHACCVAEQSPDPIEPFLRRCDLAAVYLRNSRPDDALNTLPEPLENYPHESADALLLWCDAHRQVGNLAEAHTHLHHARALITLHKTDWLIPYADACAARF